MRTHRQNRVASNLEIRMKISVGTGSTRNDSWPCRLLAQAEAVVSRRPLPSFRECSRLTEDG
jgi:hypothetical protein